MKSIFLIEAHFENFVNLLLIFSKQTITLYLKFWETFVPTTILNSYWIRRLEALKFCLKLFHKSRVRIFMRTMQSFQCHQSTPFLIFSALSCLRFSLSITRNEKFFEQSKSIALHFEPILGRPSTTGAFSAFQLLEKTFWRKITLLYCFYSKFWISHKVEIFH